MHTDSVTAPTSNIAYTGPVYEKTVTGQVVPYVPPGARGSGQRHHRRQPRRGGGRHQAAAARARHDRPLRGRARGGPDVGAREPCRRSSGLATRLIGLPYIFGGGHASFSSPGYDCSGTVSFALHGADLLTTPEDSSEFEVWGSHGAGRWVTIFSNPGHAYMTVAGLRLDTSAADDPSNQQGPRWRPLRPANEGFVVRHPLGL